MQPDTKPAKRGRKPTPEHLKREQAGIRLPRWLNEWLDTQPQSASEIVEAALMEHFKLQPPTGQDQPPMAAASAGAEGCGSD